MAKITGSGQRVLAELSQNPTARKNKYDELRRKFDALERHADFLETRLKATEKSGNQGAYNAILQQLQNAETRINNLATEMNSIAESSRYSAEQERRQQRIDARKPKTTMDKVRESLPYAIGSGIRDLIVDTGKGLGQTALYAENAIRGSTLGKNDKGFATLQLGKAGTQGSVMNPEDITMGDVADTYIKELGKNTGTYLDFLNSLAYRGFTGRGKPDSEDERFRNMIGDAVPRIFGTKDIEDPTVAKGAEIIADPLALIPVAGRVKAGVDAVTDPKLWQGIADDISRGSRSNIFVPITPWTPDAQDFVQKAGSVDNFEDAYPENIRDAYKKFKELKAQGVSPEDIYRETRIAIAPDGVPYFETDDSQAIINTMGYSSFRNGKPVDLKDLVNIPELGDYAYRRFGETVRKQPYSYVKPTKDPDIIGEYMPQTGVTTINQNLPDDEFINTLFHEFNHKLGNDSKLLNSGSNPDYAVSQFMEYKKDLTDYLPKDYVKQALADIRALNTTLKDATKKIDQMLINKEAGLPFDEIEFNKLKNIQDDMEKAIRVKTFEMDSIRNRAYKPNRIDYANSYNLYGGNLGEAMSRLTEKRLSLSANERANQFVFDKDYFKNTTGYFPEETWYTKYDPYGSIYDSKLVFPEKVRNDIIEYLQTGNRPFGYGSITLRPNKPK